MCGRTCLTLSPDQLKCACKYRKTGGSDEKVDETAETTPEYRNEHNLGLQYNPSFNTSPGVICPIIVSAKHFDDNADGSERVLIPALWGLIPRWQKGDYRKHGLTTNNARLESVATSKLYKPALESGKRCILAIEGFYEWQTVDAKLKSNQRPVYFIHMPKGEDELKLMFVAGLFDVWHDASGDSLYSFTIITYESDKHFSWLHHRTPAILETEEQVRDWLDYDRVPSDAALKLIKPPKTIVWYQVSNYVNSSKNKLELCRKPIEDVKAESEKKNTLLTWIKKRKDQDDGIKTEDQKGSPEKSPKRTKLE